MLSDRQKTKGRGAHIQPPNPHLTLQHVDDFEQVSGDSDWLCHTGRPPTRYMPDDSVSIVSENNSPDLGFRYSVNPYRGCSHGCSYCYARTTHEYLGLSAGLDFETKVLVKHRAPQLLRQWLARPGWQGELIAFSGVTDCYQPAESSFQLTRGCLQVAAEFRQPVGIVTKNALVTRDVDALTTLADYRAVRVWISVTTLRGELAQQMEPRTSIPTARLRALEQLSKAGIPTGVMLAPIIPGLNDSEIPAILSAARQAGAEAASYILLRLSGSVALVFVDWLRRRLPSEADRIEARIRSVRAGRLNDTRFGVRQRGTGPIAEQIARTFDVFARRLGYDANPAPLESAAFRAPQPAGGQLRLF